MTIEIEKVANGNRLKIAVKAGLNDKPIVVELDKARLASLIALLQLAENSQVFSMRLDDY